MLDATRAAIEQGRYTDRESYASAVMPSLVKGWSMRGGGQVTPLGDEAEVARLADYAKATLAKVIERGRANPMKVAKSFTPSFGFAAAVEGMIRFSGAQGMSDLRRDLRKSLGKSFSLSSPLSSGFVPFDLRPYVRTIYPVWTPLRNKIPRVPGQGEFFRLKLINSITGSAPGGLGSLQDDSTSEFFGGSFSSWPNSLPASGSQSAYDAIIPYKFFALTEATSWLAQFMAQGFDDLYGLASLILLQEFMLLEEHDDLCSSSQSLAAPAAPVAAARAAGSGETPIAFGGTNVYVAVTAINYWGETVMSTVTTVSGSPSTGVSVVDVTITPSVGALTYRIYAATGSSTPTRTGMWLFTGINTGLNSAVGAHRFTIQGAIPTSGTNPPASDTGTGASTRSESIISVLSGLAYNGGSGPYPSQATAGYYNAAWGAPLNADTAASVLQKVYNGTTNAFFANPSEVICSPDDAAVLAASIRDENVAAYQLRIQQSEVANVAAGVAVANFVNPVTRSMPEIMPHPYLLQGTAVFMSYTLPQAQNNLGNVIEQVMVQDYAQIGWPVIDPTFRQSIMKIGSLAFNAPQYCALVQGLQQSATTPYS